jgi:hypothetical protein
LFVFSHVRFSTWMKGEGMETKTSAFRIQSFWRC